MSPARSPTSKAEAHAEDGQSTKMYLLKEKQNYTCILACTKGMVEVSCQRQVQIQDKKFCRRPVAERAIQGSVCRPRSGRKDHPRSRRKLNIPWLKEVCRMPVKEAQLDGLDVAAGVEGKYPGCQAKLEQIQERNPCKRHATEAEPWKK